MSRADVIAKSPYTARVSLGRPHDADLAKSRNCELADQASAASVELLGRRAMTEAASQHTDCIGELTASLCKRSSTSPRCVLLPGPAGPFLLKDAARPRHVSHTDDWIGCAKFSARPGRPDLGAAPTNCSSRAVRFAARVPITARNTDNRIWTIRTRTRWPELLQHSSRRTE